MRNGLEIKNDKKHTNQNPIINIKLAGYTIPNETGIKVCAIVKTQFDKLQIIHAPKYSYKMKET